MRWPRRWWLLLRSRFAADEYARRELAYEALLASDQGDTKMAGRLEARWSDLVEDFKRSVIQRGNDLFDADDFQGAEYEYRRVVYEDLSDYEALRGLAASLMNLGEYEEATYYLSVAKSTYPDDLELRAYLCQSLMEADRIEESLDECDSLIEMLGPGDTHAALQVAQTMAHVYWDRTRQVLEAIDAADSQDPEAVSLLGWVEWKAGDTENARSILRRAEELDPDHATTHYYLSLLVDSEEDLAECFDHARRALDLSESRDPELLPLVLTQFGWLHYLNRDFGSAEHSYGSALELDPSLVYTRFMRALNHLADGRIEDALGAYDFATRVVAERPRDEATMEIEFAKSDLEDLMRATDDRTIAEAATTAVGILNDTLNHEWRTSPHQPS